MFSIPGAFQFSLLRKGWYICRSLNKANHQAGIEADFNLDNLNWLRRCSFALRPLAAKESPLMNCFGTFQPPKRPEIPSTTMTIPVQTISTTPATRPTTATTPHQHEGKMVLYVLLLQIKARTIRL